MDLLEAFKTVDCGSCRACCRSLIVLMPEKGDDPGKYRTQVLPNGWVALERNADGSCVYLGDGGCTIHPDHPAVCRKFDCADAYDDSTRRERRRKLATGQYDKAIFEAGRLRADARFAEKKRALAQVVVDRVKEKTT